MRVPDEAELGRHVLEVLHRRHVVQQRRLADARLAHHDHPGVDDDDQADDDGHYSSHDTDLDGDGLDDLLVGSGKGGPVALFKGRPGGAFEHIGDGTRNDVGVETFGVHRECGGRVDGIDTVSGAGGEVVVDRARVAVEIVASVEL